MLTRSIGHLLPNWLVIDDRGKLDWIVLVQDTVV